MPRTTVSSCGCPGAAPWPLTRREMLRASANGFGLLALSALLGEPAQAATPAGTRPHFPARARNVILCFMDGGVSHVDSFDPKPRLAQFDGKDVGKVDNPTANVNRKWLRSPWQFRPRGQSGLPVSDLFPHIATCVDDLAVIRSM